MRATLYILLIVLSLQLCDAVQYLSVCRPGYEKAGGRCYRFSTKQMSWARGAEFCEQDGSEIAAMETQSEFKLIASLVSHKKDSFKWKFHDGYAGRFWIGAYRGRLGPSIGVDLPPVGVHYWHRNNKTHDRVAYTLPSISSISSGLGVDCFTLLADGNYNDYWCYDESAGVLCEESPKQIPWP